jgi:hypothetical protein
MPKGGHAVTTISGVSGDGLGFRKENFIGDALPGFFRSVDEISFAKVTSVNPTFINGNS